MYPMTAKLMYSWRPENERQQCILVNNRNNLHVPLRYVSYGGGGGGVKVLVACEFSGIVRDAFIAKGHNAISCDLLPTEKPGQHYQGDVKNVLGHWNWLMEYYFDMVIAFPPCTHLAVSGARWFANKQIEQWEAIKFFMMLAIETSIPRIAIENPIGIMSRIIQPWMFGHGETKATCLWLKGLPKLVPTNIVEGREHRIHRMAPGPNRAEERSKTYIGIAHAMADQWGNL